jgi:hypothetical protein
MASTTTNIFALAAPSAVSALPLSLPTTLSRSDIIHDVPTDAWVQLFADRIFVGVTQRNQRVGTYVTCQAIKSPIDNAVDFSISTVLGNRDDAVVGVYARRLAEKLIQERVTSMEPINLLLGISLLADSGKDPKMMFQSVVDFLFQLIREAFQTTGSG